MDVDRDPIKDLHFYVLDCLRCKLEIPELATLVQERANQYKAKLVIIEDVGPGTAIIQCLRYDAPYMPIVPFRVKGSKEVRVAEASVLIERGQVLFPTDAPWLGVLESELLAFPNGRNDDQVDSVTQFLIWAGRRLCRPPKVALSIYSLNVGRPSGGLTIRNLYAERMNSW